MRDRKLGLGNGDLLSVAGAWAGRVGDGQGGRETTLEEALGIKRNSRGRAGWFHRHRSTASAKPSTGFTSGR